MLPVLVTHQAGGFKPIQPANRLAEQGVPLQGSSLLGDTLSDIPARNLLHAHDQVAARGLLAVFGFYWFSGNRVS